MQYFVSIENTSYFYWQVELLIQSFKRLKLQDQLVIAIAENDEPKMHEFAKNITGHQSKFLHQNFGEQKKYKPFNRIFSLVKLMEMGVLQQPFAMIHADMVLKNPLKAYDSSIVLQHPSQKTFPEIEKYVNEVANLKNLTRSQLPELLRFDGTVIFNNMPKEFFYRVWQREEELLNEHGPDWPCEAAAWALSLFDMTGLVTVRYEYLDGNLLEHLTEPNFVHYKHGIPPVFNKRFYRFDKPMSFSNSPFDCLMQYNPSTLSDYVQKTIESLK